MKWLKITVVLFLVTWVKSGPTRNEVDPVPEPELKPVPGPESDPLILKRIDRIAGNNLNFTLSKDTPEGTTQLRLVVKDGENETNFNSIDPVIPSTSYTFKDELTQFSQKEVDSELLAINQTSAILWRAKTEGFQYPKFPDTLTGERLDDPRKPQDKVILRVEGSLGTMNLITAGTLITEKEKSHYYQELTDPDYTPCTEEDGVTICDFQNFVPVDLISNTTHDIILGSAILSYGSEPDNQAKVKLTTNLDSGDIYEAILMPSDTNNNSLCTLDGTSTTECPINWGNPSSTNTLQLIIIRKTTDAGTNAETWTTSSVVIQDRQLIVNNLGNEIIEGRWTMLGDESNYRLVKTCNDGTKDSSETISVNCEHISSDPKLCFGYFPVVTGPCTLTVAYEIKDSLGTYNELDQIESSTVPFSISKPELAILSRHTTRRQNQLMADVNICFQHLTPTEGRAFSHYEMLIINEKGQWLKHRILEEEEASEGGLCFAPFPVSTEDFDMTEGTKVVVSQRGLDGVTVLASGEASLF